MTNSFFAFVVLALMTWLLFGLMIGTPGLLDL